MIDRNQSRGFVVPYVRRHSNEGTLDCRWFFHSNPREEQVLHSGLDQNTLPNIRMAIALEAHEENSL